MMTYKTHEVQFLCRRCGHIERMNANIFFIEDRRCSTCASSDILAEFKEVTQESPESLFYRRLRKAARVARRERFVLWFKIRIKRLLGFFSCPFPRG